MDCSLGFADSQVMNKLKMKVQKSLRSKYASNRMSFLKITTKQLNNLTFLFLEDIIIARYNDIFLQRRNAVLGRKNKTSTGSGAP